jgi:hypothetical protein
MREPGLRYPFTVFGEIGAGLNVPKQNDGHKKQPNATYRSLV